MEKDISELFGDLMKMQNSYKKEIKTVLPENISNDVVILALQNFDKQGFDEGTSFDSWSPLTLDSNKAKMRKHSGKISSILVDSGRGRRAVASMKRTPVVTDGEIILNFEVTAGYMQYHNEGIRGRLPKREFIGASEKMQMQINKRVEESFNRVENSIK